MITKRKGSCYNDNYGSCENGHTAYNTATACPLEVTICNSEDFSSIRSYVFVYMPLQLGAIYDIQITQNIEAHI